MSDQQQTDPAMAAVQEILHEQFVRLTDLTDQEQADIIRKHMAEWLRGRASDVRGFDATHEIRNCAYYLSKPED